MKRRGWRRWAHRAGLLWSPSAAYLGVPFGTARQRRRRRDIALARLARQGGACRPTCPTCTALRNRASEGRP